MTNKEKLLNFVDYINTLEKEPYAKKINRLTPLYFYNTCNDSSFIMEEIKPDNTELQSFISRFRDCFEKSKSSHVNSEKISSTLREYIKDDTELYAEWERINKTWDSIRNSDTNIVLDNRVDGITLCTKKYKTLFEAYEEIQYGRHLHLDPPRKENLNNMWIGESILNQCFLMFIFEGYRYLLALKTLIEIAYSKNLLEEKT